MKNYILIIISCLLMCCDTIEPPYLQNNTQLAEKVILIEKFTGHKCSNCPEASRKVDELQEFYGDNLISVSIHPGDLIEFTGTDENYPYDFTTNTSDAISNDMGATFLPLGTINRIPGGISNRCFTKDQWAIEIDKLLYDNDGNPAQKNVEIEINTSLNELNKELTIEATTSFINLTGLYKLSLIILENGIIAPQIDGTEYVANYEHNHIYRCAVNGTYGETINSLEWAETYTMTFNTGYNINWTDSWSNLQNCYVLAYVYNAETLIIEESVLQHIINE